MRIVPAIGFGFVFAFGFVMAGCGSGGGNRQSSTGAIEVGSCHVGGCSGELCSDQEGATSVCTFEPALACYRDPSAVCEPQRNGTCGWTRSRILTECLTSGGP